MKKIIVWMLVLSIMLIVGTGCRKKTNQLDQLGFETTSQVQETETQDGVDETHTQGETTMPYLEMTEIVTEPVVETSHPAEEQIIETEPEETEPEETEPEETEPSAVTPEIVLPEDEF